MSYEQKHNEANGEDNADGERNNLSWNCGVEGESEDPEIAALRERQKRNFMAPLLLSQGVPMIRGGDELSHTQRGNNNTYCQDNELSWLDWQLDARKRDFLEFTWRRIALWREQPTLQRRKFLQGRSSRGGVDELDGTGERIAGDSLLLPLNAHHEAVSFRLPGYAGPETSWELLLDTFDPAAPRRLLRRGQRYALRSRSLSVLRLAAARPHRRRSAAPAAPQEGA